MNFRRLIDRLAGREEMHARYHFLKLTACSTEANIESQWAFVTRPATGLGRVITVVTSQGHNGIAIEVINASVRSPSTDQLAAAPKTPALCQLRT